MNEPVADLLHSVLNPDPGALPWAMVVRPLGADEWWLLRYRASGLLRADSALQLSLKGAGLQGGEEGVELGEVRNPKRKISLAPNYRLMDLRNGAAFGGALPPKELRCHERGCNLLGPSLLYPRDLNTG